MNFNDTLLEATTAARTEFLTIPFLREGASGQLGLQSYLAFLTEAYHHVKETTPLLMAAGLRCETPWLLKALAHYIVEEVGHEEWILSDIAACGGDADAVRDGQPRPATELMVAYAYYNVLRKNPVGLFGMVLVLEGTSVSLACAAADAIQKSLKLPDTAFSYLRSHGTLDIEHMAHFANVVNRLDQPNDQAAVIHCANQFYRLYGDIFRSLPMEGTLS
ncbi:MAG: iron-containing redox enzyme family protein [Rhodocyclaceae bacterium]|nr:iron-containing redox enzyme family protein [Rhodocyclaceae bacterium]